MKNFLKSISLAVLIFVSQSSKAQELDLSFYADAMVNAYEGKNRTIAAEKFNELFQEEIKTEHSFSKEYEDLKFVSIQYPEDKSFRIFSWQVKESEDEFSYYNILQRENGEVTKLFHKADIATDDTGIAWDASEWPAQLIYNIKETVYEGEKAYLIFGLQQEDRYTKIKVADVLTFNESKPMFGAPLFYQDPDSQRPRRRHRLIIRYGADSNASLNYNPNLELIVYDHLIQRAGMMPGQGIAYYPDGSYEAYQLDGDKWVYIEKLFNQVLDEAPRPKPVSENGGGVFGRKKKKN